MMQEWLKSALKHAGLSQAELARRMEQKLNRSIDRTIVNKIAVGKRDLGADEALAIAEITGFPLPSEPHQVSEIAEPGVVYEGGQIANSGIPVLGAVGSGDFAVTDRTKLQFIEPPPKFAGRRNLYALYVLGDSMQPPFRSGQPIFIDPEAISSAGDYILFEAGKYPGDPSSRRYLKRLVDETDSQLVCKQTNPPVIDIFRKSLIKWVHRVVF